MFKNKFGGLVYLYYLCGLNNNTMAIKEYAPHKKTVPERIAQAKSGTLSLGIEGKYTNIRIWVSRLHAPCEADNTMGVFMRLDCANQYSTPLSEDKLAYLLKPHPAVTELAKFGFPADIKHLEEIIDITKDMPIRECIAW